MTRAELLRHREAMGRKLKADAADEKPRKRSHPWRVDGFARNSCPDHPALPNVWRRMVRL